MKKYFIIFTLFLIAIDCFAWKKKISESETGDEIIAYTKKISNYKFTYNVNEFLESEYLLIENKSYKYRIVKGFYNNKLVAFYRKFDADFNQIETSKVEFYIEMKDLKIKEMLLEDKRDKNKEITQKVIDLIDGIK